MSSLTIEEVRRGIQLSTQATQEAQNSINVMNNKWISYYKNLAICQQLIAEHANQNEVFFSLIAAQKICKTYFKILSEETAVSLFQTVIQCMQEIEVTDTIANHMFCLIATIFCIYPNETIKDVIMQLAPEQVIQFYIILGEQMNSLEFVTISNIDAFSEDMLSILNASDPSPLWVNLFSSYCTKATDLTVLLPLVEKLQAAAQMPESFALLFKITSAIFKTPYDNLSEEETPFIMQFIEIILTTITSLMQGGSVDNDCVQKILLYLFEIFEYSVQLACSIDKIEFTQTILNTSLEIMSALSEYHTELILTVISLAEFFYGTLTPQIEPEEGQIATLEEFPYIEQLQAFVSILFDIIAVDDSECEPEDKIHTNDLAKAIYSITSVPKEYYGIFQEHITEVNPGILYFAAYCNGELKRLIAQELIQALIEGNEAVLFAMQFIQKSFVFFHNDQKINAIKYAWQYFLQEQTPENAFVLQNCARVGPAYYLQNIEILDYIIANCEGVSGSLVPALYLILLYPTISMQSHERREEYMAAANQLIENKFDQIVGSGNMHRVLRYLYRILDAIAYDFSVAVISDSYEQIFMKMGKLSMSAYQSILFPFITQLIEGLLTKISEHLTPDDEETQSSICELMAKGLSIQIISPTFVFSWMTEAFQVLQTGSIYELFMANAMQRHNLCLMNHLTPEDIEPFISVLPELSQDALKAALMFICFLQKIHTMSNFSEDACNNWSNEAFLAMFPLERIIEILHLPGEASTGFFLDIIPMLFPVGGEPQAPPEWGNQIAQAVLELTKGFYTDEGIVKGILTLVHLSATGLIDPNHVKEEILAAESDQEDIDAFVKLFDIALEEKVNPTMSIIIIENALTSIGSIIINRARESAA